MSGCKTYAGMLDEHMDMLDVLDGRVGRVLINLLKKLCYGFNIIVGFSHLDGCAGNVGRVGRVCWTCWTGTNLFKKSCYGFNIIVGFSHLRHTIST